LLLIYLKKPFLLPLTSLASFNSRWTIAFLVASLVVLKGGKGSLISGKRRARLLSHEVQSRPPCVLNSLSEESLGAAESTPSPRPGQRFMSKGLSV